MITPHVPFTTARLDELQEWERYRLRERQRQIAEWEERERIMEEKRRRVQAGLGLEVEEPTASRRQAGGYQGYIALIGKAL